MEGEELVLTSGGTTHTAPDSDDELELGTGNGEEATGVDPLRAFCRRFRRSREGGDAETWRVATGPRLFGPPLRP